VTGPGQRWAVRPDLQLFVGEVVGHGAVLLEGPLVQVGQQLGDGPVEVDQVATPIVGVVAG